MDPNTQRPAKRVDDNEKPRRERTDIKTLFAQQAFEGKYEYVCIERPPWGREKDEDDEGDEDGHCASEEEEKEETDKMFKKPASSHPDRKWIMMQESMDLLDEWSKLADYCNPDMFDMYVYNDFHGYGLIEILDNELKAFNKELNANNSYQMWAIISALAQFLNRGMCGPWMMVDDSEKVEQICGLVGYMILTALDEIERVGQLRKDSAFRDLGHVVALCLLWSGSSFIDVLDDEEGTDWKETIVAYAKKAEVELGEQGVGGIEGVLEEYEDVEPLEGKAKVDRWGWKAMFKEYKEEHSRFGRPVFGGHMIGGDHYNIMKWTREERAKHAFDEKDPLEGFTDEEIASGTLVMT